MYCLTQTRPKNAIPIIPIHKKHYAAHKSEASNFERQFLEGQPFKGEHEQSIAIPGEDGHISRALVGVNESSKDPRWIVQLFARLCADLPGNKVFFIEPEAWPDLDWRQAGLGWGLATYKFDRYLEKKKKAFPELCAPETVDLNAITHELDAIFLARNLINTPANDLGPLELCDQAKTIAAQYDATIEIIEGKALLEKGYPTIFAVGKGSLRPPALIDMRWGRTDHPKVTLVGKGVVFDTGGLNLKPANGMILMKKDMGGAAIAMGLAQLIMSEKLPIRLRLLAPTVENSPGNHAFRPGDVIRTRKNITVEIGNTDAEGRLILCDALAEAVVEEPDLIIDLATLTGAARIALGQDLPALWTPSDEIGDGLVQASREVADPIWRMPLWAPYKKHLKSSIADLNNIANTAFGGAITAALYLYEFVKPYQNWVHFDVYGWRSESIPGTPKGGEANALRAIFRFLQNRYSR